MNKCADDQNRKLAELYKCFADETRLKILRCLFEQGEVTVGRLAQLIDLSDSAISHQLSRLRHMRLVAVRREGKFSFYHLQDEHIYQLILQGLEHIDE
jgi:ArsR family transcriptional regulator